LARDADAEQVRDIYAPSCAQTAVSFETTSPTVEEMRGRIHGTLERFPWLVCAASEKIVGYAYARPYRARAAYRWSTDVSVYIGDGWRRLGVGRALYVSLLEALNLLGYYNAYAGIALPNPASVGLHEALGFEPVGVFRGVGFKLGEWQDVGWWHRRLRPLPTTPSEPRLLTEILGTSEWAQVLVAGLTYLRESPWPEMSGHPVEE
jgi:phosphinothricin acetyltransferase